MSHIENLYFCCLVCIPPGIFLVYYLSCFLCSSENSSHRIQHKTQGCFVYLQEHYFQQVSASHFLIPSRILSLLLLASSCQLGNLFANCCWSSLKMKDNTNIQWMHFTSGKKLSNANSLSRLSSLRS